MKAVYSFWNKPFSQIGGGYFHSRHFLHLLGLSVAYSKQHFSSVEMYCCQASAYIFEELGWFDKVIVSMNKIEHLPVHHWAVAKLVTFSMQEEPFIHIDNDAYLMKGLSLEDQLCPILIQCPEHYVDFAGSYKHQIKAVQDHKIFPYHWHEDWVNFSGKFNKAMFAYNTGIFGGCDIEAIQDYSDSAVQYMIRNGEALPDINTTIEQCYLAMYAHKNNVPIRSLINDWRSNNQAIALGYRHYWGGTKKMKDKNGEFNLDVISRRFEQEFPLAFQQLKEHHYLNIQTNYHGELLC